MTEKNVCILGGTGFVGSHLVPELAREGYFIRLPTRYRQGRRDLLVLPTVSLIQADVHQPVQLARLVEGCDAVINLVGIINERGRRGEGFRQAHVELARKVVTACREAGVPRLLHMSALKANAERGPSLYLRTKGEAEQLVREQAGDELNYTIFEPSVMFGPGDSFINRFARLLKWFPVMPLAMPNSRMAPVYVGDVVAAMMRCLNRRETFGMTYQLCGPRVYSLREITKFIIATQGIHRLVVGLPEPLSRLQAALMELVPGKPFSLDNYRSLTVNNICSDNGFETLGLHPHSMEAIVPGYLRRDAHERGRLSTIREHAGR